MKINTVLFKIICVAFFTTSGLFAQEQEFIKKQGFLDIKTTSVLINTFASYNQKVIKNKNFRFRKAIREAKQVNLILEFISVDDRILMSKLDYLRMLRRTLNQSASEEIFLEKMNDFFPLENHRFLKSLELKLLYENGRRLTFNGYLNTLHYLD